MKRKLKGNSFKWSAVSLPGSTCLGFHGGKQSSGLDRGRSPLKWGDFLVIRLFICPSIRLFPPRNCVRTDEIF